MKKVLKRYSIFIFLLLVNIIVIIFFPAIGQNSLKLSFSNLVGMLQIVPPIFILLGLLDVWVEKEKMMKLIGDNSGILGVIIAFLIGSAAAGPLYAAFPVAGVLLRKGSKLSNVFIFIGAWSTTKIPLLLFEASSMGWKFMLTRLAIDIPGIAIMAYIIEKSMTAEEKKLVYDRALEFE